MGGTMMDGSVMGFMMAGGGLVALLVLAVLILGLFALVKYLRGAEMRRTAILPSVVAVSILAAIAALAQQQGSDTRAEGLTVLGQPVTSEQIARGQQVYGEYCASCHGANLEGQPDWRRRLENGRMPAPPHDESGHTWHHSDQNLFDITKLGVGGVVAGYESDMPAFGDMLSDDDIAAVLAFIKSTWPERERDAQARITASDGDGS